MYFRCYLMTKQFLNEKINSQTSPSGCHNWILSIVSPQPLTNGFKVSGDQELVARRLIHEFIKELIILKTLSCPSLGKRVRRECIKIPVTVVRTIAWTLKSHSLVYVVKYGRVVSALGHRVCGTNILCLAFSYTLTDLSRVSASCVSSNAKLQQWRAGHSWSSPSCQWNAAGLCLMYENRHAPSSYQSLFLLPSYLSYPPQAPRDA